MESSTVNLTGNITWPAPPMYNSTAPYIPPTIDPVNRRAMLAEYSKTALQGLLAREGSHIHKDTELVEQAWAIAELMLAEGNNKHNLNAW